MNFLNESNIAKINKYYNVKIYINSYGVVVPPPPSFSPPPVPVKNDNIFYWDSLSKGKEPEQEQEDPRVGEIQFYNLEKYKEYNEAYKTNNNIEYVKEHVEKVAQVGDIFCEYSCHERYYYIVTRLTSKSYFYKPLKGEKVSYWRCNNDYGQSKYTYYTNKYDIDEYVERCKRLTNTISCVNPDIHNYENGFIFERRY